MLGSKMQTCASGQRSTPCPFARPGVRRSQGFMMVALAQPCAQAQPQQAGSSSSRSSTSLASFRRGDAAVMAMAMTLEAPPVVEAPQALASVQALAAESFHRFLEDASDTLTVVDFFTEWCGPCKLIAPELERMAQEYGMKLRIAKLNCGQDNESKRLAIALGIKALPTFHLYRGGKKQAEMTGAKAANLRSLIDKHL